MQQQEGWKEKGEAWIEPLVDESCMDIGPILTLSGAREMMMRGKLAYGEASESVDACWRRWGVWVLGDMGLDWGELEPLRAQSLHCLWGEWSKGSM